MAVVKTGSLISDIRGSVGDETFSRNQGGLFVRTRTGPGGTPTPNQIAITDAMTDLSQAWSATLTDAQRDSWRQYAAQHPRRDQWGNPTLSNGYTRFISVNFAEYVRASAILRTSAPAAPPLPLPIYNMTMDIYTGTLTIVTPLIHPLDDDSNFRAYLYLGDDVGAGVNYYSAPFVYRSTNTKLLGTWSTSPWRIYPTYSASGVRKRWTRLRVQNTDTGAISPVAQAYAQNTISPPP